MAVWAVCGNGEGEDKQTRALYLQLLGTSQTPRMPPVAYYSLQCRPGDCMAARQCT